MEEFLLEAQSSSISKKVGKEPFTCWSRNDWEPSVWCNREKTTTVLKFTSEIIASGDNEIQVSPCRALARPLLNHWLTKGHLKDQQMKRGLKQVQKK